MIRGKSADRVGLRYGYLITKFDGIEVGSIQARDKRQFFSDYVKNKNIQDAFPLEVVRIRQSFQDVTQGSDATSYIRNISELRKRIASQKNFTTIHLEVNKTQNQIHVTAYLGKRKSMSRKTLEVQLVADAKRFATSTGVVGALMSSLVEQYVQTTVLKSLTQRFVQNELWENGQRFPIFRYLHTTPMQVLAVMEGLVRNIGQNTPSARLSMVEAKAGVLAMDTASSHPAIQVSPDFSVPSPFASLCLDGADAYVAAIPQTAV